MTAGIVLGLGVLEETFTLNVDEGFTGETAARHGTYYM